MDATQTDPLPARRPWPIDLRLGQLIGRDVRVAVDAFSPVRWNGEALPWLNPVRELILPDNSRVGALPVFFEGRLRQFERQIGVVYVALDAPSAPEASAEGIVRFRHGQAVVLRGPATVRLTYPFRVEPLPHDADNYWEDLRIATAQFRFPTL